MSPTAVCLAPSAHFPLLEAVDLPILDAPILDVDAIMLLPPWAVPGRVL